MHVCMCWLVSGHIWLPGWLVGWVGWVGDHGYLLDWLVVYRFVVVSFGELVGIYFKV